MNAYNKQQPPAVKYFLGLDLAQTHEFTALCILEQRFVPQADQRGYTAAH
jgi:hypothetical protein